MSEVITPTRPALRYHGGKWMLAPWIISHMPKHRVYTEAYGGAASILLRKPESYAEIYNDLDESVVNLFRVMQSPKAYQLIMRLRFTPFAQREFELAYEVCDDPVESARRLIIRSFMGFGSNGHHRTTGFRANSNRSGSTPAHDWQNYPDALIMAIKRFSKVIISCKPAIDVIRQHDCVDALHYVDPPYVHATRTDARSDYGHEMNDVDHAEMLRFLRDDVQGMVILSGYPSDLYDDHLSSWTRIDRAALADGARKRTECLWLNAAAVSTMPSPNFLDVKQ